MVKIVFIADGHRTLKEIYIHNIKEITFINRILNC